MKLNSTPAFCGKIKLEGLTHAQFFDKNNNLIKDPEEQEKMLKEMSSEGKFRKHWNKNSALENGYAMVENNTFDAKNITGIDKEKFTVKMPSGNSAYMYHSIDYQGITDYNQVLSAYNAAAQNDVTVSLQHDKNQTHWG